MDMSQRICKGSPESEEVAHYVISKFLEHKRAEELVNEGKAMVFMSGMIHRSFHSSTSPYHTLYRQKGRVHGFAEGTQLEQEETVYDADRDLVIEAIQGILEEMQSENTELWYRSKLFSMWLENPNYSELSRQTDIPRTSISQAVEECKQYVREQLKKRNIDYDF